MKPREVATVRCVMDVSGGWVAVVVVWVEVSCGCGPNCGALFSARHRKADFAHV